MEPFLGEVSLFAGNFAPRGWTFADGQLLPISQFSALFAILGTQFGGDGRTTFALPDLRGRVPIGFGSGPGLPTARIGERIGTESFALTTSTMPAHDHEFSVSAAIPLPRGLPLALSGLAVLGWLRWRRRARA
ncbi:tail fiber protein [Rhodobacteraceae bacterium NNCM2]|nr:tail fiber protein [Coraliihabitans acroporae]